MLNLSKHLMLQATLEKPTFKQEYYKHAMEVIYQAAP